MAQAGASPDPLSMMKKMLGDAGHTAPPMMQMCMGMCSQMLSAIQHTTDMAAFATPELQHLFGDWLQQLEADALQQLRDKGELDIPAMAAALNISEQSAAYLVAHLSASGAISMRIYLAEPAS
jgi:DNA-binding transcriptional regulator YiaG